ncbi:helix-turn-helix domain-containing protein [Phocaeicola vulgatus]|nr:helix-turn-helix domain-containing protein [Phocaeicola vulgatus]
MMSSVPLSLEKGVSHLTFVKRPKKKYMEIVNIEAATFQEMKMTLKHFSTRIRQIVGKTLTKNTEEWLDNQDVCTFLKISPRTLQNLRNNGSIPYTRIERKIFYNKRDIWNFIEERNIQSNKRV